MNLLRRTKMQAGFTQMRGKNGDDRRFVFAAAESQENVTSRCSFAKLPYFDRKKKAPGSKRNRGPVHLFSCSEPGKNYLRGVLIAAWVAADIARK